MAKNIVKTFGEIGGFNVGLKTTVPAANGTTVVPKSGTPCLAGNIPGVAEGDIDTTTLITTLNTFCIAELLVAGIGVSAVNAAISAEDLLYMQTDGSIDKNSVGTGAVKFGTAYGNALNDLTGTVNKLGTDTRAGQLIASGQSAIIRVWVGKIN